MFGHTGDMCETDVSGREMVHVDAGTFTMGDDRHYAEERPAHRRSVGGFLIDVHPVTNAQFGRFVEATGYRTVAERPLDPADFPGADPEDIVPGSLAFTPTTRPVPMDDWRRWWRWAEGAAWRRPDGAGSTIDGLERHPVVHVCYEDALEYAAWAGKSLPTEAEWEYAARGGTDGCEYAWGDHFMPDGKVMANTWHGRFPYENRPPLGFERTSPVGAFPPNGFGLFDMIGNVWEWTISEWTDDHRAGEAHHDGGCCAPQAAGLSELDRRVMKGGSHLCAPSYCRRYRPSARQGQQVRSSASHLGFRCIIRDHPAGQ